LAILNFKSACHRKSRKCNRLRAEPVQTITLNP